MKELKIEEFQEVKALFSSSQKSKKVQDSTSHRVLWHMHESLNIDKK